MWIANLVYNHNGVEHKESLHSKTLKELNTLLDVFTEANIEEDLIELHIIKEG